MQVVAVVKRLVAPLVVGLTAATTRAPSTVNEAQLELDENHLSFHLVPEGWIGIWRGVAALVVSACILVPDPMPESVETCAAVVLLIDVAGSEGRTEVHEFERTFHCIAAD